MPFPRQWAVNFFSSRAWDFGIGCGIFIRCGRGHTFGVFFLGAVTPEDSRNIYILFLIISMFYRVSSVLPLLAAIFFDFAVFL